MPLRNVQYAFLNLKKMKMFGKFLKLKYIFNYQEIEYTCYYYLKSIFVEINISI
jgi:hypothetical protein